MTLVRAPAQSFVESGVFVVSELATTADVATASAEWQDSLGSGTQAFVRFDVLDPSGAVIASNSTAPASAPPSGSVVAGPVELRFAPGVLQLWSTTSAPLYTVTATLVLSSTGVAADVFNVSTGFRRTRWDGATGFWLNGKSLKQRGFSHHNSFAGVGVAMPQRLDLFRVQVCMVLQELERPGVLILCVYGASLLRGLCSAPALLARTYGACPTIPTAPACMTCLIRLVWYVP